jgi:hypothetical protein
MSIAAVAYRILRDEIFVAECPWREVAIKFSRRDLLDEVHLTKHG